MQLNQYQQGDYRVGAGMARQLLWFFVGGPLVRCQLLPFSGMKVRLLRLFGAKLGERVRIKPGVRVKFPWRLTIGDDCWIGEDVWIDNLAPVTIGSNCCISQGAYLCTGSHDWSKQSFDLITEPICIMDHAWIAARANVAPGVTVGEGAVLAFAALATSDLEPWSIHAGLPARRVAARRREQPTETVRG